MVRRLIIVIEIIIATFHFSFINSTKAQVGEYRNVWAVGLGGGCALNKVSFTPNVPQMMHTGATYGVIGRYTSEKYFSTICSLQLEVNMTQLGWKEKIQTINGEDVINPNTGVSERYERNIRYLQIPLLAHLAWGKERHGVNAFINAGPQIGFYLDESINKNYDLPYIPDNFPDYVEGKTRVSAEVLQETMDIENHFDYGIAAGAGIEWDIKYIGRFSLEARYYYGLGNLYGDSKKDEFAKSSNGTIYVRLAYLKDL